MSSPLICIRLAANCNTFFFISTRVRRIVGTFFGTTAATAASPNHVTFLFCCFCNGCIFFVCIRCGNALIIRSRCCCTTTRKSVQSRNSFCSCHTFTCTKCTIRIARHITRSYHCTYSTFCPSWNLCCICKSICSRFIWSKTSCIADKYGCLCSCNCFTWTEGTIFKTTCNFASNSFCNISKEPVTFFDIAKVNTSTCCKRSCSSSI